MRSFTGRTAVLSLFCLAQPGLALAQSPAAPTPVGAAPPVTVNSCGPVLNSNSTQTILGVPVASTSSGIAIEFVNESKLDATLVNFAVDSNNDHFVIRDVGTFSPGVSIKHTYRNGSGQGFLLPSFIAPNVKCSVSSVKFADGTVWRKGQPPAAAATAPSVSPPGTSLSVNPTRLDIELGTESALFLVQSNARVAGFKETDTCTGVATVFVAASADTSVTYSVRPIAAGSCSASITDELGSSIAVPITVR